MNDNVLSPREFFFGCDSPSGCTTCGGLRPMSSNLQTLEVDTPGAIAQLLMRAIRLREAGGFSVTRIAHAFGLLDLPSRQRVLQSWGATVRSAPACATILVSWALHLAADRMDQPIHPPNW